MRTPYVFNPSTGLYYPLIASGSDDSMSGAVVTDGGVPLPPPYTPTTSDPLVDYADYCVITATAPESNRWTWLAMEVSEAIENYCYYSWRKQEVEVPLGLQVLCARMIQRLLSNPSQGLQSESYSTYSYSIDSRIDSTNVIGAFKGELNPYRVIALGM